MFTSPHAALHLPQCSLPALLLAPAAPGAALAPGCDAARLEAPLFFPPPAASGAATRTQAQPLSVGQLALDAHAVAAALLDEQAMRDAGGPLRRGDVVALFSGNQHDYLLVVLAIQLAGGVPALCNPAYTARELANQLRMVQARAIVASSVAPPNKSSPLDVARNAVGLARDAQHSSAGDFEPLAHDVALWAWEEERPDSWLNTLLPRGRELGEAGRTAVEQRLAEVQPQDTGVLCFSSGTSGTPKAVCLPHSALVANTVQASFLLHDRMNAPLLDGREHHPEGKGWYEGAGQGTSKGSLLGRFKRRLSIGAEGLESKNRGRPEFHQDVLPQFHCYGLLVSFVALHTATPRVVLPRFDLRTFLSVVQERKVTFAFIVPPILLALATSPLVEEYDVSSLWRVASGAASLADELAQKVYRRLGIRATDGYGMTEMSPIICMQTLADIKVAPGSVGVLAPNTKAKVLGPEGQELSYEQEGELLLQGPQMMSGYLHNDAANAEAFYPSPDAAPEARWLRTGDIVRISKAGYVTITDRQKDVIKAKGFQVSPAELEALLFRDDSIADVSVVGVRDPKDDSELVWAFVVPKSKPTDEEAAAKQIMQRVNSDVAGYKRIKGVTFIDEVPKSAAGKVLKRELREKAKP